MISFNDDVLSALKKLNNNGYKAYIVGGAIRDLALGITPDDYDVVTNAPFDVVPAVFDGYKTKLYANKKCMLVRLGSVNIELSNFKAPKLIDDAKLRDFTVNAIYYSLEDGLVDPLDGLSDIESRTLRLVNDPLYVFELDPLRILRAIRFELTKALIPTEDLVKAANQYASMLIDVKTERIASEINPIFVCEKPSVVIKKYQEVISALFPVFGECVGYDQKSKWHHLTVDDHILSVMDHTKPDLVTRLAAFFHDIKKPYCTVTDEKGIRHFPNHFVYSAEYAEEYLEKYHYSNNIIKDVKHIVLFHDNHLELDDKLLLDFIHNYGTRNLDKFFDIQQADLHSQNPALLGRLEGHKKIVDRVYELVNGENKE